MKRKGLIAILASIILFSVGCFEIVMIHKAHAQIPNWIAVDPPYYKGMYLGEIFAININISVNNMYAWEFKLYWNRTLVNCTGYVLRPPVPWVPDYWTWGGITWDYNSTHGRFWVAASGGAGDPACNGTATIYTLTFEVMYQPYFPEAKASCKLNIDNVNFSDPDTQPIPMTVYNGLYEIEPIRGDVNGDLCVDVFDKVLVGAAFGATYNVTDGMYWHQPPDFPEPCIYCPHTPNADINGDGIIDIFDKVIVGYHFGQGCSP